MWLATNRVRLFMFKTDNQLPPVPTMPAKEIVELCQKLIFEESEKTIIAMSQGNLVEIADGLMDVLYVALFAANAYGLPVPQLWKEVCDNNDTKWRNGVIRNEAGKVQKPEGWIPPRIKEILEAAVQQHEQFKGPPQKIPLKLST